MNLERKSSTRLACELTRETGAEVKENAPLAPLTSWKVGGCADILARPHNLAEAESLFAFLHFHRWPWVVLGRGTNVLVPDEGIRGVVIQLHHLNYIRQTGPGLYTVGAGGMLAELVRECSCNGDAGIEDLAAIPGSVGGAVVMNAGAGSQSFADVVSRIRVVKDGTARCLLPGQIDFGYRRSGISDGMVVLEVDLELSPGPAAPCIERRNAALQYRKHAQNVWMPNAGSVFRNPEHGSAWKLIDACGLRGFRIGGAQVSSRHTNFIVNTGAASAAEIKALIRHVQHKVYQHCGVNLEPEIHFLSEELREYEA